MRSKLQATLLGAAALQIATYLQWQDGIFFPSSQLPQVVENNQPTIMTTTTSTSINTTTTSKLAYYAYAATNATTTAATTSPSRRRRYGDPNLTKNSRGHPHKGAKDEFGRWGYVHDPTILRHRQNNDSSWPFSTAKYGPEEEAELCADVAHGPEGAGEMAREIFGSIVKVVTTHSSDEKGSVRVFCAVYSYPGNNNQSDAIRETWAKRCDGFMVASTETDHEGATVHIPHAGPHEGKYQGIWQKVRSMLAYMHDNFLNDYDFFLLCGDDTYVIMENLKAFLTSPKFVQDAGGPGYPNPMYVGAPTHPYWMKHEYKGDFYYNGGGSGYLINAVVLRVLVQDILPHCQSRKLTPIEDVYMGECLQKHLNVTGYDTRDTEERERFFVYDPLRRAAIKSPAEALRNGGDDRKFGTFVRRQIGWLHTTMGWTPKYGTGVISPTSISFHLVQPAVKMRRYERLFYRMRDAKLDELDCGGYRRSQAKASNNTTATNTTITVSDSLISSNSIKI